jgi:hypothetical protein
MTVPIRLISATDPEWDSWVERAPHDVFHTAAYHRFADQMNEGRPFLAVCGTRERFLAWPYLLRRIDGIDGLPAMTWNDANSVYGYPGPIGLGFVPGDGFLEPAWSALRELWKAQRVVSVFTRLNPLLENHRLIEPLCLPSCTQSGGNSPQLALHGQTVSLDLRVPPEEGFRSYKKHLRQDINKGRRAGLVSHIDGTWRYFEDFLSIYHRTMANSHANESYFFPAVYFEHLRKALDSHVHLMVTSLAESAVAAVVALESEDIVHAHLGGSADQFRHLGPFKVLCDDLRLWGVARRKCVLHLGGGRGGRADSLFEFKSHFSNRRHDFFTASFAVEPEVCEELSGDRCRYASTRGLEPVSDNFFPMYRVPLTDCGRTLTQKPSLAVAPGTGLLKQN